VYLQKIAGMLGSDQDGEVLNAARMASAILKAEHRTWADLIAGRPAAQPVAQAAAQAGAQAAAQAAAQASARRQ
jgi:hypothetical protein